ncbi:golgin subfamily A member 2-like [Limulus polyphemus]|uniref:Golgin subfamily A member 2-like n=1 Tax=Limulus polyphemus TaxID=6850 RepID=A0ABM1TJU2_LIMPO|nr:golgin subfamily A member 2-like [Limulus polyphemus]
MEDNTSDLTNREKKLEAGLKKLKKFQQKNNKKGVKKKCEKSTNSLKVPVNVDQQDIVLDSKDFTAATVISENQSKVLDRTSTEDISDKLEVQEKISIPNISKDPETQQKISDTDVPGPLNTDLSSTESLRQITQQLNGLMSQTHAFINGEIEPGMPVGSDSVELERRNQELANLLESHRQANEQLQYQLQELKAKINRTQREFERERQDLQEKAHRDQASLKDQLQVHIQTIGILVAEKTELQSSLSQSQQTAKQKAVEIEELQGRLRASRQRVSDLEKEISNVSSSSQQLEKSSKESSKEVDRLKLELYKLSKSNEELKQQNSELAEKLNKKLVECQDREKELADVSSKLAMAELHVQQISSSDCSENTQQLEELHHIKLNLEKKVAEYKESFERLTKDKDQMSQHYQDYTQKLSQELTSVRDELKQAMTERDGLAKEKSSLSERLEILEEAQKVFQSKNQKFEELSQRMESLCEENEKLKKEIDSQASDNTRISQLLVERETHLEELQAALARQEETYVDKFQLLEKMQSEKVAASRAMVQNKQLKQQLEELQDGLVKVNNDKLELTEQLHHEQHISKELGQRLTDQEEELSELRNQVTNKSLAERIDTLLTQNSELRMALARQAEDLVNSTNNETSVDKETDRKNDLVTSLSASVKQLEMERDYLLHEMKDQQTQRDDLKSQLTNLNSITSTSGDIVLKEDHESLKNSMKQLEEKFKKTMDQIAELSDQKQQLEHLVTQLQGETDTIEEMKTRLSELQNLVMRLLEERRHLHGNPLELCNHSGQAAVEVNGNGTEDETEPSENIKNVPVDDGTVIVDDHVQKSDDQTAKKIMDLFTEIESSNLIEKPVPDTFHPCPVCSGRLLTV